MAQLIVRNLEPELVQRLRERAAANGRSAESEHRALLREALMPSAKRDFKAFLLSMPTTEDDEDALWARRKEYPRDIDL